MLKWVLAGLMLLSLTAARAEDPALEARVVALSAQLRCLVCQNQTIAESDAPLAVDLRKQVREKLEQGQSEQQIADYMVARYGDFVLYRPPVKAITWALWFGPGALLAAGLALLWRRLRVQNLHAENEEPPNGDGTVAVAIARSHLVLACTGVLAGAAALYAALGTPAAFAPPRGDITVTEAETLIRQLSEHLQKDPANANGWLLLARAQTAMGHYDQAAGAYRKLMMLTPDDSQLQTAYAEVLAQARDKGGPAK